MRYALLLAASVMLALVSCSGGGDHGICDPMFFPGVYPGSLSLGTNGTGYLGALLILGDDCSQEYKGRLFHVDAVAKTTKAIPLNFAPQKTLARSDGNAALVMGYPGGVVWVSGTSITPITFGDGVWDIEPARDHGWVVSAKAGGSWYVSAGGIATKIAAANSYCGAYGAGSRFLVCNDSALDIRDSTGALVTTLAFTSPPFFVAAAANRAAVLTSSSVVVIEGDAVQASIPLDGDFGTTMWLSSDGNAAFVRGENANHFLRLDSVTSSVIPIQSGTLITDALFDGPNGVALDGALSFGVFDAGTGAVTWINGYWGNLDLVSRIAPDHFLLVAPTLETPLVESATVPFFLEASASGTGANWPLQLSN